MSYAPNARSKEILSFLYLGGTIHNARLTDCDILAECGCYGEQGMLCDVTMIQGREEKYDNCTCYWLMLDFNPYMDYNKTIEKNIWYSKNHETVSYQEWCEERNQTPTYREELCVDDINELPFDDVNNPILEYFLSANKNCSYLEFLEKLITEHGILDKIK